LGRPEDFEKSAGIPRFLIADVLNSSWQRFFRSAIAITAACNVYKSAWIGPYFAEPSFTTIFQHSFFRGTGGLGLYLIERALCGGPNGRIGIAECML
jgi:hypothetical protein